ncbi:MAG: hypothetical protein IJ792_01615 [Oscillospiraceae bacterium]|nr:hypothetical protein [Oscillospiraceae bacterium]
MKPTEQKSQQVELLATMTVLRAFLSTFSDEKGRDTYGKEKEGFDEEDEDEDALFF